ncbi:lipopolysaccharide export system permease protein [Treponema bryantii]|uniref:Lipopolysaccharide export system permease protein n=1 Tax=Treponema bryantii TaxID=163 RepID=A0A1H9A8R2_9SPIR|nr:LptF/LptG family permease [Treponema bryantii]BDC93765.1 membrane protein [Treponema bryantii]SEP73015.1 lipopolysaccharide export system permease protein [Treponema bryantii]
MTTRDLIQKIKRNHTLRLIHMYYDKFQVRVLKRGTLKNHILIKYLFKDLFLYFLVSFFFFFMVFFVNQILLVVEELLAKSAPIADVMRIMVYSLPFIIAQSAPFATLVGFLMSLGGMMTSNEILIFRAAGFSFFRIFVPVALLGICISIGSFFVNDYLLPLGQIKYNQLMRKIVNSTPSIELESNSVKHLDTANIVIGNVDGNKVSDVVIIDSKNDEDRLIVAGESVLVGAKEEGVLMQFDMNDSTILTLKADNKKNYDILHSKRTVMNVFDSTFLGTWAQSPREMTTYDLTKRLNQMKSQASQDESLIRKINLWGMEWHKKFAIPFGSIFFALLAFSMAFLFGKNNGQMIGLFLGIVICVLYWAVQIVGQLLVTKVGLNAFWCIWTPNILIGLFGLIFLTRLIKK